jgi:hypothetical protein
VAQLATRADGEAAYHLGLQGALPTSYFLLPTSYFLLLLPTYWLLATATDYWLLAADYWLLATDYWLLATGYQVLFLDVLFPLKVKRVIYIDSDQLVRAVR